MSAPRFAILIVAAIAIGATLALIYTGTYAGEVEHVRHVLDQRYR